MAMSEREWQRYERDWDAAIALFRKSEPLEANGLGRAPGTSNNPSLVYIHFAEGYRVPDLMREIALSDAFYQRTLPKPPAITTAAGASDDKTAQQEIRK